MMNDPTAMSPIGWYTAATVTTKCHTIDKSTKHDPDFYGHMPLVRTKQFGAATTDLCFPPVSQHDFARLIDAESLQEIKSCFDRITNVSKFHPTRGFFDFSFWSFTRFVRAQLMTPASSSVSSVQ